MYFQINLLFDNHSFFYHSLIRSFRLKSIRKVDFEKIDLKQKFEPIISIFYLFLISKSKILLTISIHYFNYKTQNYQGSTSNFELGCACFILGLKL